MTFEVRDWSPVRSAVVPLMWCLVEVTKKFQKSLLLVEATNSGLIRVGWHTNDKGEIDCWRP